MKRYHWRKQKLLAMLNNRRQFERAHIPSYSSEVEIELETTGVYLLLEASTTVPLAPIYLRTE